MRKDGPSRPGQDFVFAFASDASIVAIGTGGLESVSDRGALERADAVSQHFEAVELEVGKDVTGSSGLREVPCIAQGMWMSGRR